MDAPTRKSSPSLHSDEERFRLMVEAAPTGLLLVDEEGRIVLASAHAEEMFGFEAGGLEGRSVEELVPEAARSAHPAQRAGYHSNPSRRLMGAGRELWAVRRDGTQFPVEIGLGPLETELGTRVVCNVADITERKRLEKEIFHSQKMESIGRLAGGLAHDFNNLLSVILTNCGLLLNRSGLPDEHATQVAEIRVAAQRAASLTGQLLAVGRRQVLSPRVLDLNGVLEEIQDMLRRLIGEDVELLFERTDDIGSVRADPAQLIQVVVNLAINARDAMPGGGKLTLTTDGITLDHEYVRLQPSASIGPHVRLTVADTGVGMDEEVQRRLFEPFFTTKEVGRGTGLGLSTAMGIVKQSGGHMTVYSEVGHGAVFRLYLPALTEKPEELEQPQAATGDYSGTETILVVEDADMVRESARRILVSQGYRVLTARNGIEALEISRNPGNAIDLLLTDVVMPGMNGRELSQRLLSQRPQTKLLLMSGHAIGVFLPRELLEPGMHLLQKPFTVETLSRKVWEVLRGEAVAVDSTTILVLENEADFRAGVCEMLQDGGMRTIEANTLDEALDRLRDSECDAVLSDVRLPGSRGRNPVEAIRERHRDLPIVLMSGMGPPEGEAPAAFLQKPFEKQDLLSAIQRALTSKKGGTRSP